MVRFTDSDGSADAERFLQRGRSSSADSSGSDGLARVAYLPGAAPADGAHPSARRRPVMLRTPDVDDPGDVRDDEPEIGALSRELVEAELVTSLARRSLSERELRAQALELGLDANGAEAVVSRLRELGYADDRRLAEQMRHSLSERKRQSKAVVSRAMTGRGIPAEIVDDVLDEVADDDELEQAIALAVKRLPSLQRYDDETVKRRLTGFLSRRGYPGGIVRHAIEHAMGRGTSGVFFS